MIYGRDVTPNAHALSERFVTLDHFFASGGNSADGHQWLTQANETEYPLWPLYYGRSYPSEGNDPLAYSSGGFLWENAQAKGKRVTIFGEYAPAPSDSISGVRRDLFEQWREPRADRPTYFRDELRQRYNTRSEIPSLDKALVRSIRLDTGGSGRREGRGHPRIPRLEQRGHDGSSSWSSCRRSHRRDRRMAVHAARPCRHNDLALGRIVDGLTHSRFWPTMGIFVVEDDAQNGVDPSMAIVRSPRDLAVHAAVSWTARSTVSRAW